MAIAVISLTVSGCSRNNNGKIPDPGGVFSYDRVLVFLTETATAQNRDWTPTDFPEFEFSEIKNNDPLGTRAFLVFYLVNPSRDNVRGAVYVLQQRAEVYSAHLDTVETGGI